MPISASRGAAAKCSQCTIASTRWRDDRKREPGGAGRLERRALGFPFPPLGTRNTGNRKAHSAPWSSNRSPAILPRRSFRSRSRNTPQGHWPNRNTPSKLVPPELLQTVKFCSHRGLYPAKRCTVGVLARRGVFASESFTKTYGSGGLEKPPSTRSSRPSRSYRL